jgi:RNA polymerase sigma-70 factor (ECF subfamily)
MDEQKAINFLKEGDLQGLETLIQLYYFRAVKAAYLIVQDRQEAEDIVQDAYLHACEKIHQLAEDRFGPWFLRSVVNASIKTARKRKSQISLSVESGAETLSLEDILADRGPTPESAVEMNELSQQLWQALQRLSAEQRAAVVLKYYLEMSEVEMTTQLDRPLSTIKWRLYTARERLRSLLRPNLDPQPSSSRRAPRSSEKKE